MKAKLVFPPPSKKYGGITWGTEDLVNPPQSGIEVLAAVARQRFPDADISCISDSVASGMSAEDYAFSYRTVDDVVESCADADVVGVSVWFHNLESGLELARKLKEIDLGKRVVLGSYGVSNPLIARLVLEQHPAVDYIARGDGEETIVGILRGFSPQQIPNLFYRVDGKVMTGPSRPFNLNRRPRWDFTHTQNYAAIMEGYDSRTRLFGELRKGSGGSFIGRIGVQFTTGCEKAEQEGPCAYCTSQRTTTQSMLAERFWGQIGHLYSTHGITEYFLCDDIAATLPKLRALSEARKKASLPDNLQFRAYGYAPYFTPEDSTEMIRLLREVGIINLFLGIENFSPEVNSKSHKRAYGYPKIENLIGSLTENKVDVFLPLIVGMPGESEETLRYNADCLDRILDRHAKKTYGEGGIVRVDLSGGMPLRGTPWYNNLARDREVQEFYLKKTGMPLQKDIDPDYTTLREASAIYVEPMGVSPQRLNDHFNELSKICLRYLRPQQIGGFDFQPEMKT